MSKNFKRFMVFVVVLVAPIMAACGNPGGSCNGTDAIGHGTECLARLVFDK
jgi:hypothetical protein